MIQIGIQVQMLKLEKELGELAKTNKLLFIDFCLLEQLKKKFITGLWFFSFVIALVENFVLYVML